MTNPNMAIWDANKSIDQRYTKQAKVNGQNITSFSLQSVVMMATEQFGPIGKGWGYEVVDERDDEGAIIQYAVKHENGDEQPQVKEIVHTLIIRLWYTDGTEKIVMPTQAGHTPKLMRTKYGPSFDGEYYKKTLADAIKKSLSMLGFGADIFLGLMDDKHYLAMQQEEQAIKFESEKSDRIHELTEKVRRYCEAYKQNSMPHSLTAQLNGHRAETHSFCRKYGIDPTGYIKKLETANKERLEEFKSEKESK